MEGRSFEKGPSTMSRHRTPEEKSAYADRSSSVITLGQVEEHRRGLCRVLSVRVLQSRALYQHIAATWAAVVAVLPDPPQRGAVADSPGRSQMTPSALV